MNNINGNKIYILDFVLAGLNLLYLHLRQVNPWDLQIIILDNINFINYFQISLPGDPFSPLKPLYKITKNYFLLVKHVIYIKKIPGSPSRPIGP